MNNPNVNNSDQEKTIMCDLVHVHSVRMYYTMCENQQTHEEHSSNLDSMSLIGFSENLRVRCRDHLKNKTCLHVKKNLAPMFFPKKSNRTNPEHHEHFKHQLMEHVPWFGACVCKTHSKDNLIITWDLLIEEQLEKGELVADHLRKEIDNHVENEVNCHDDDDDENIVHMDNMMDDGLNMIFYGDWIEAVGNDDSALNHVGQKDTDDVQDASIK